MYTVRALCALWIFGVADLPPVAQLLEAWENGCRALHSYDVYVTAHQETFLDPANNAWKPREKPLTSKHSARQILSEGKRRVEVNVSRPGQKPDSIVVWDTELAKSYNSPAKQLSIAAQLEVTTPSVVPEIDYEGLYRTAAGNVDRLKIMRERPDTRIEKLDGSLFVIYTPPTTKPYNFSPFGLRIWLDPSKNFLPKKIQHLLEVSGKEIVYDECENTFSEVLPGIWAVTRADFSSYPPILQIDKPPKKATSTTVSIDMNISKFNPNIPDSIFQIDIPVGTSVFDRITGAKYIYGKANDRASHLSQLVLQGKESVEKLRSISAKDATANATTSRPRVRSHTLLLLLLNVAALILVGAVFIYRIYRRRHTKNSASGSS